MQIRTTQIVTLPQGDVIHFIQDIEPGATVSIVLLNRHMPSAEEADCLLGTVFDNDDAPLRANLAESLDPLISALQQIAMTGE